MLRRQHEPERWTWACKGCEYSEAWPCATARARMLAEGDLTSLRIAMWGVFELAAEDFPRSTSFDFLYEQFIAWTSPGRRIRC